MRKTFRALLLEGLRKFGESGFTSEADLQDWMALLHSALERELPTDEETRADLQRALEQVYGRDMRTGIVQRVPGVSRYTLDRVAPYLRAELDRRIFAGADLIRLNRKAAVEKTLQRFSGWTTSQPPSAITRKGGRGIRDAAREIGKPIAQLKFERRRVAIDQGFKLISAVSHVVAMQNEAIAAIWHDRGEFDKSYDARPDHLARSGKLFIVRDSWATEAGLIKKGSYPYTDSITQPAEEIYCSCYWMWIVSPRALPKDALTKKGLEWIMSGEES